MPTAWYHGTRADFLAASSQAVADQLAGRAAKESLDIAADQAHEWKRSVSVLQESLKEGIPILRHALQAPGNESIRDVILEYDFRRRGLRMDCILLADGALFVIEFKRTRFGRADRDQVVGYAVNLLEFHKVTRLWAEKEAGIVAPILVRTKGNVKGALEWPGFNVHAWPSMTQRPLEADARSLASALQLTLSHRRSTNGAPAGKWLNSPFAPSSSIIDATVSLFGNHDVTAIAEHAAPREAIAESTNEIRQHIRAALLRKAYHIVFVSGAPGAGKTLVGLDVVMRGDTAGDAVFVTGNAPLVDVLNKALKGAYTRSSAVIRVPTGYRRRDLRHVIDAASYKIVKAHRFLGDLTKASHRQEDGRVLVFDEAQRTYKEGRLVVGKKLPDHEADLILSLQRRSYSKGGAVIVALIGHNQAINSGELGMIAWLEAAERKDWTYSISNETLALLRPQDKPNKWQDSARRTSLQHGHLAQSMRFYRNSVVEKWAGAVLEDNNDAARAFAAQLTSAGVPILLTRDLEAARDWARSNTVGNSRSGLIASAQAKRLAADGLFVDFQPNIANWMLAPSSDVRSSSMLEAVQNQYQVQGLELDYCIVCWDADLRRSNKKWAPYKFRGAQWQVDKVPDVAKNGYRVLLTRARKGMVIFVPRGDSSGHDETRDPRFYDGIAECLEDCGAVPLD